METVISARGYYDRGRALRQAKKYDHALAELQHATDDPNYSGQAHTQVALCLRAMGRHEEAVTALRYALDSSSLSRNESVHVLYLLGQSLESLGRYAEAIEAYNWVRHEDAEFPGVKAKIRHLCGMTHSPVTQGLLSMCGKLFSRFGSR